MSLPAHGRLACGTCLHARRSPSTDLILPTGALRERLARASGLVIFFPLGSFSDRLLVSRQAVSARRRRRGRLIRKSADRKSTRLNSSHSQISYAVFCLKKKKT